MMNAESPDVSDGYAREGGISPTLDATLDLLSNRRRRYALYYLREQGGSVPLDTLAAKIASWESDGDDDLDVANVRADLYHSQLPRLDSANVVAFDADEGIVELADESDSPVTEYLDLAAREENVV